MRIYTREYIDDIVTRMRKTNLTILHFERKGNLVAVENHRAELLRLSTILLGQADRLEEFSNLKPGSKPSQHCLRYAQELRNVVDHYNQPLGRIYVFSL